MDKLDMKHRLLFISNKKVKLLFGGNLENIEYKDKVYEVIKLLTAEELCIVEFLIGKCKYDFEIKDFGGVDTGDDVEYTISIEKGLIQHLEECTLDCAVVCNALKRLKGDYRLNFILQNIDSLDVRDYLVSQGICLNDKHFSLILKLFTEINVVAKDMKE